MQKPSPKSALVAASIALLAVTTATVGLADGSAPADGEVIVAKVGVRTITAREVERRLAAVPPFQLRYFGKTDDEIRRKFLDEGVIKEALYAEGADAEKMRDLPEITERIRGVLKSAMLAQIRDELAKSSPITEEDVRAYYDAHADKYHAPARIMIWRILVGSKEDAQKLIEKAKQDLSPKRWNELARDESLDKSTSLRGGNLGFAEPDGKTSDPNVNVDPALLRAAEKVKDGELVPEPIAEGSSWAIIWRRQSQKPISRPLELETPTIRQLIAHERIEKRTRELVTDLRKQYASDLHPETLELLEVSGMGELSPVKRPGTLPVSRKPAAGSPVPSDNNNR